MLAAAPAASPPVVAVAAVPVARPSAGQLRAMVGQTRSQQADLLLLVAKTPQQAAATMDAISGYVPPRVPSHSTRVTAPSAPAAASPGVPIPGVPIPEASTPAASSATASPQATAVVNGPPDVSVIFSPSGNAAVIQHLPASVRIIGVAGNLLRPPMTPGGRGGLALLWACLLLGFAYLATRTVAVLRAAPAPPRPGGFIPPDDRSPVSPVPPAADATQRLRASYSILTRHQPRTSVDGWQPQCPWCGSFSLRAVADPAADHSHVCLSCGHRWPTADRESWPDTILSHRRRNLTDDLAPPTGPKEMT